MNKSFAIPVSSCIARDVHLCIMVYIWIRSRNRGRPVTRPCYQLIAKPGNKTATVMWPYPYSDFKCNNKRLFLINEPIVERNIVPAASQFFRSLIWNEWYINLPNQFKILMSSLLIRNKNLSSSLRLLMDILFNDQWFPITQISLTRCCPWKWLVRFCKM